jgi:hypothetical protein
VFCGTVHRKQGTFLTVTYLKKKLKQLIWVENNRLKKVAFQKKTCVVEEVAFVIFCGGFYGLF